MLKRILRTIGLLALAATIIWLTREHLLPAPRVKDEPRPHYRSTPPPPPREPDDLTRIKGIGPVYAARLNDAGIKTFRGLAETDAATLAATIDVSVDTVADWTAQAAKLI